MGKNITMDREYRMGIASFEKFAEIQSQIRGYTKTEIDISCVGTTYISPAFGALFGSLIDYGKIYGKKVKIEYNKEKGKRYINNMGIDRYYTSLGAPNKRVVPFSSINYKQYNNKKIESIYEILKQLPKALDEKERGMLISIIGEIFNNANDHSGFQKSEDIKIYYCGDWNSKNDTYIVSIYDTGVGISKNVSEYLGKPVNDVEALEWAFGDGNSTQNTEDIDYTRGIGLNYLEKFIIANKGTLYVGSGNAICVVKQGENVFKTIKEPLRGTIYVVAIKVGEKQQFVI